MEKPKIITNKGLDKLLGILSNVDRNKSIPNPTAQYSTLCLPDNELESVNMRVWITCNSLKQSNPTLYIILTLQMSYGLRISEVLNLKGSDYRSYGKLFISGLKFSQNRYIVINELDYFFKMYKGSTSLIFSHISRFYVYREYKKLGISFIFGNSKKSSVTHAPRHLTILQAKENKIDTKDTQVFIGHKSIKSTEHYENKEKKKYKD